MGSIDLLEEDNEESDEIEKSIAKNQTNLTEAIVNTSEYKQRELVAFSVISTSKYYQKYVTKIELNKKHIGRKHSKECLTGLKHVSDGMGNQLDMKAQRSFFSRFR